jgi:hypothetical protein
MNSKGKKLLRVELFNLIQIGLNINKRFQIGKNQNFPKHETSMLLNRLTLAETSTNRINALFSICHLTNSEVEHLLLEVQPIWRIAKILPDLRVSIFSHSRIWRKFCFGFVSEKDQISQTGQNGRTAL